MVSGGDFFVRVVKEVTEVVVDQREIAHDARKTSISHSSELGSMIILPQPSGKDTANCMRRLVRHGRPCDDQSPLYWSQAFRSTQQQLVQKQKPPEVKLTAMLSTSSGSRIETVA